MKLKVDARRLARGVALQALYEFEFVLENGQAPFTFRDATSLIDMDARTLAYLALRAFHEDGDEAPDDDFLAASSPPPEVLLDLKYQQTAHGLVNGILENRDRLDGVIQRFAPEWPVDQMALIDRNILRMALYEFGISRETPRRVAINEAVELAKIFGSDAAPAFVNGVLGSLAKQHEGVMQELAEVREEE